MASKSQARKNILIEHEQYMLKEELSKLLKINVVYFYLFYIYFIYLFYQYKILYFKLVTRFYR